MRLYRGFRNCALSSSLVPGNNALRHRRANSYSQASELDCIVQICQSLRFIQIAQVFLGLSLSYFADEVVESVDTVEQVEEMDALGEWLDLGLGIELANAREAGIVCGHMSPEHGPEDTCLCFACVGHVTPLKLRMEMLVQRENPQMATKVKDLAPHGWYGGTSGQSNEVTAARRRQKDDEQVQKNKTSNSSNVMYPNCREETLLVSCHGFRYTSHATCKSSVRTYAIQNVRSSLPMGGYSVPFFSVFGSHALAYRSGQQGGWYIGLSRQGWLRCEGGGEILLQLSHTAPLHMTADCEANIYQGPRREGRRREEWLTRRMEVTRRMDRVFVIKSDLGGSLHLARVSVESAVCVVSLLLDSGSELHETLRNGLVGALEDVDQSTSKTLLVVGEEGNGSTILASTTSTTDTMDVILNSQGESNVDDNLDGRDIKTSCGNIGSNEKRNLACLESIQTPLTLVLAQITMDTTNAEALGTNEALNSGGFFLVQAEDQDTVVLVLAALVLLEQSNKAIVLVVGVHNLDFLNDSSVGAQLSSSVLTNVDTHRLLHESSSKLAGTASENLTHFLLETFVKHAIGLIQNSVGHVAEINGAFANEVVETTGGCDNDVGTSKSCALLVLVHTTVDADSLETSSSLVGETMQALMPFFCSFAESEEILGNTNDISSGVEVRPGSGLNGLVGDWDVVERGDGSVGGRCLGLVGDGDELLGDEGPSVAATGAATASEEVVEVVVDSGLAAAFAAFFSLLASAFASSASVSPEVPSLFFWAFAALRAALRAAFSASSDLSFFSFLAFLWTSASTVAAASSRSLLPIVNVLGSVCDKDATPLDGSKKIHAICRLNALEHEHISFYLSKPSGEHL
ncbi:ATP-dependent RNA helicase DBP3, partial [Aureobasidium melanogenum]